MFGSSFGTTPVARIPALRLRYDADLMIAFMVGANDHALGQGRAGTPMASIAAYCLIVGVAATRLLSDGGATPRAIGFSVWADPHCSLRPAACG